MTLSNQRTFTRVSFAYLKTYKQTKNPIKLNEEKISRTETGSKNYFGRIS